MSAKIFDTILEDGNVADDDLSADEARRVKDMILAGHGGSNAPKGTAFPFLRSSFWD